MEKPFNEDWIDLPQSEEVEETATEDASVDILRMAQEYGVLNEQKRTLEKELEAVKDAMKLINDVISERMVLENPNIKVKIGETAAGKPIFKTVYVKSQIWAGYVETEDGNGKANLVQAMKDAGLGGLVSESYNANSLSGYVRGLDPDIKDTDKLMELVPDPMRPFIKLTKTTALAVKS